MSNELKPCPFCGGKCDPKGWMNLDAEQGPECETCGVTAGSVEAWNTRTESTELEQLRKERDELTRQLTTMHNMCMLDFGGYSELSIYSENKELLAKSNKQSGEQL